MTSPVAATYECLSLLESRVKRLPNFSYKLSTGTGQYGYDVVLPANLDIDEKRMSVIVPFADGQRRDGVGDLLEVAGIDTSRHRTNPIILFDHGKQVALPVALAEDPDSKAYTVVIDPLSKQARFAAFFYRGTGINSVDKSKEYDHAVFCEQLFDLLAKRYIRAGSIGYQVVSAKQMPADYGTGIPQGLHLLQVLMLEGSVVVMPANADTVRKSYPDPSAYDGWVEEVRRLLLVPCCGKTLSPYLVKSLGAYVPEDTKVMTGYEGKAKVRLADVKEAEKKWQQAMSQYGPNNMATDRAEMRYRELKDQWDAQKEGTKSQPSDDISPEKAREILHDGTVHGEPLTDKQRAMFGAAAGKKSAPSEGDDEETAKRRGYEAYERGSSQGVDQSNPYRKASLRKAWAVGFAEGFNSEVGRRFGAAANKAADEIGHGRRKVEGSSGRVHTPRHSGYTGPTATHRPFVEATENTRPKQNRAPQESRSNARAVSKDLPGIRKKYRTRAKSFRRRLRKSAPGSSLIYVASKDLESLKTDARAKGINTTHLGPHRSGTERVKLMGDDAACDQLAAQYGKLIRTLGRKSMSRGATVTPPEWDVASSHERANLLLSACPYMSGAEARMLAIHNWDKLPLDIKRQLQAVRGVKSQPSTNRGIKAMPDNTDGLLDEGTEEQQVTEPFSSQVLRRLHEHQSQRLQEYDGYMPMLEHEEIKAHVQEHNEGIAEHLDQLEALHGKHHPDLKPLGGDTKDMTEEETEEVADELEDVAEDAVDKEEDTEEEKEEGKDMDTMDDAGVPSDSEEEEEPTPEEAIEGMQKSLRGRYRRKAVCPKCGKVDCRCKGIKTTGPNPNAPVPKTVTGKPPRAGRGGPPSQRPSPADQALASHGRSATKRKSLQPHERSAVGEASGFLGGISQEGSQFGDEERFKSYHYGQTLAGIGQLDEAHEELAETPTGQDVPPAEWEPGAGAKAVAGRKGSIPGAVIPGLGAVERAQEGHIAQGPHSPDPGFLPGKSLSHRKTCKEAGGFLTGLAHRRDFGDMDRTAAFDWHKQLEAIGMDDGAGNTEEEMEDEENPGVVMEDEEATPEPGEMGEKALMTKHAAEALGITSQEFMRIAKMAGAIGRDTHLQGRMWDETEIDKVKEYLDTHGAKDLQDTLSQQSKAMENIQKQLAVLNGHL